MRTDRRLLISFLFALLGADSPAYCSELKPLPDLQPPAGIDQKQLARIEDLGREWWHKNRGLLAEESLKLAGYFSVARPLANFAERNDRVWEIRVVHMHSGGPTGILWVNEKSGRVVGLGADAREGKAVAGLRASSSAADGHARNSAFQFVGHQVQPFCKYEKKEANLATLCRNLKEGQVTFDEFHGQDRSKLDQISRWALQRGAPTVVGSPADVIGMLRRSRVVSAHDWHNKYHHVAHKDQHGYITADDGSKIIWMMRPGGLGLLVYPDGGVVFLASQ